jgi:hypothetical protein
MNSLCFSLTYLDQWILRIQQDSASYEVSADY